MSHPDTIKAKKAAAKIKNPKDLFFNNLCRSSKKTAKKNKGCPKRTVHTVISEFISESIHYLRVDAELNSA